MSEETIVSNQENEAVSNQLSLKEINFRRQEEGFKKLLAEREEEIARLKEEQQARSSQGSDDDDSDDEPYVDRRKLKKALTQFEQKTKQSTKADINNAVSQALYQERQANWIKSNPDFKEVLKHAQKLADKDPELAETILEMPDNFERQKLVYRQIKAMGLHKPEEPKPSVQDRIANNPRSMFYKPSGVGSSPYVGDGGDFSRSGQKSAYEKMQELKSRLRL